ncbi:Hypothetical protein R9X50_00207300 [Acrodontium crateriforme]|uniref:RRM domain-containing protein n=1 Tax=Acrodontium crateriforme TaxID=150365 RepID=A0AAQ3RAL6_9PEZI|nr:Hypothetical protein R9X50_00207300 [Acrodontium crateriforme]
MPPKNDVVASFDQKIQENRKERNAKLAQEMLGTDPKKLAQEMLGKSRRSQTPRAQAAPASLASRVGVNKRSNSVPRPNTAPPRNPRQLANANVRPKPITTASSSPAIRSNGHTAPQRSVSEINIRGAASGAYIVRASNFAPGTTAADIESVMSNVGGMLNYCKLVAQAPTVIAEMEFVDKVGADAVIEMFNNKKADGRVLYVYYARDGGAVAPNAETPVLVEPEAAPADETMEVDENAIEREEQDRIRAERRGRNDVFPTGPRDERRFDSRQHEGDYNRSQYRDGRQGYEGGRGGFGRGGGYGRGGGRMYSDGMRRGGGQSYRP